MRHPSPVTHHSSRLWTVVPVRGFAEGKSRLAPALDAPARYRLNRGLLEHTLGVIERWRGNLERCVVVSPCSAALAMAARLGAHALAQTPDAGGLNAAAGLGASYAARRGGRSVLILPCDLPHLSTRSLAAMVDGREAGPRMVIAPDSGGTGTNALLVSVQQPFEFRFGERSCARHIALAAERRWEVSLCRHPELEFDLDTPENLAAWHGRLRANGREFLEMVSSRQ